MSTDLVEKYKDSNLYVNPDSELFSKAGFVFEKRQKGGLYGSLRVARYYEEYKKFGVIIDEEMHNEFFDALRDVNSAQLKRTIRQFESSDMTYFWLFVRDRLGEVWMSEEDIKKREEILDKLRQL